MTWLPDSTMGHLRAIAEWPDFSGTKYEIIEKLGQGGMASVYVALDRDLDRRVAVKVIHDPVGDPIAQQRMLSEARIIARLEHPGILPIHDLGFLPDGRIYYVMKLVRGSRLDEFIDETISLPDRLRLFLRVCDSVAFAHAHGVIHRDLKPSNILIGDFGDVLVIDWGLAKEPRGPEEASGYILGTPGYMPPEQERGESDSTDQRSDVYALGILLESVLPAGSPRSVRAISRKARSAAASDRYPTVAELSRDVTCFLDGERVAAFPEGLWETGARLVRRYRTVILLIATYLVVRVILLLATR